MSELRFSPTALAARGVLLSMANWAWPKGAASNLTHMTRQMIGRVLRPADHKTDAIILDHSGAVFRHGFAEDPVEWTLDPDRHAESPVAPRSL